MHWRIPNQSSQFGEAAEATVLNGKTHVPFMQYKNRS